MSAELTEALRLYLGWGSSSWPLSKPDAVLAAFGPALGSQIIAEIDMLLGEVSELQADWATQTLAQATEWVKDKLRNRHPDLDEEAIDLLGWEFSYSNK